MPSQFGGILDTDTPAVKSQFGGVLDHEPGQDKGGARAALQGFNSAVPFGNRITAGAGAGIASLLTDEDFGSLYDEARANQAATSEANPDADLAGTVAGIATSLPIGITKTVATTPVLGNIANALSSAATTAGNFVRGGQAAADAGKLAKIGTTALQGTKAAIVAAPVGAAYGAGAAPEGEQLQGGLAGAGLAAGISGALPILGAGAGATLGALTGKLASRNAVASGEIVKESLSKPLQKIYDRLRSDYPDDAEFKKILYNYGSSKDKALIQSGGARTSNLAEGAAQYPSGGAKASEFFDEATGKAPDNIKNSLAKTVSPDTAYYDTLDNIVTKGREKAAPIYSEAFKFNQSVKSPVIDKILQTPEGKSALGEAAKNMQNEMARVAVPDKELTEMARELSIAAPGGVARGLKLRTLDYVKKSMDDTINKAYRSGDEAEARRIIGLKNSLVGEIDAADKSGLYKKARSTSGDYITNKNAMDAGLNFLTEDAEIVKRNFKDFGATEKEAYRNGVVKALRNNIDGRYDGQNVARIFEKPATRQKLASILSPSDYTKLIDDAKATDNIFKLRNQIVGNSRTAGRQIAAQEFDSAGQELVSDLATRGAVGTAYKTAVNVIKNTFNGLNDKSAGEVANILYETEPKVKYQIVKSLVNEANSSGAGLRSTQAAQKLNAFYKFADAISLKKSAALPVAQGASQ